MLDMKNTEYCCHMQEDLFFAVSCCLHLLMVAFTVFQGTPHSWIYFCTPLHKEILHILCKQAVISVIRCNQNDAKNILQKQLFFIQG